MSSKGALNLILDYGSGSSDDDVPSGRVSTKRTLNEDDSDEEQRSTKRVERLPVPTFMTAVANKQDEYSEDPAQHDGRIRSFPHERGNWVTYAYIPFEPTEGFQKFLSVILEFDQVELKLVDDLHISLTKTVILRHHWIEIFTNSIKEKLTLFPKFIVMFDSVSIYCNEERTRTFIGLQIRTGFDSLLKLTQILDACLEDFKLPTFYKDPSFHMSIAWCLGDCEATLKPHLPDLNAVLQEIMSRYSQDNWNGPNCPIESISSFLYRLRKCDPKNCTVVMCTQCG